MKKEIKGSKGEQHIRAWELRCGCSSSGAKPVSLCFCLLRLTLFSLFVPFTPLFQALPLLMPLRRQGPGL